MLNSLPQRALLCAAVATLLAFSPGAAAQSVELTVTLTNGGEVTGAVESDVPGQPLILRGDGGVYRIPRADIAATQAAPTAVAVVTPAAAAVSSGDLGLPRPSIALVPGHHGLAHIEPGWDPALISLVQERNAASERSRLSMIWPLVMTGVGVAAGVGGVVLMMDGLSYDPMTAGPAYGSAYDAGLSLATVGALVAVGGGVFTIVRMGKRRRGREGVSRIDRQLLQFGVVPAANLADSQAQMTLRF